MVFLQSWRHLIGASELGRWDSGSQRENKSHKFHRPQGFQTVHGPGLRPTVAHDWHLFYRLSICAVATTSPYFKCYSLEWVSLRRSGLSWQLLLQLSVKGQTEPDYAGALMDSSSACPFYWRHREHADPHCLPLCWGSQLFLQRQEFQSKHRLKSAQCWGPSVCVLPH